MLLGVINLAGGLAFGLGIFGPNTEPLWKWIGWGIGLILLGVVLLRGASAVVAFAYPSRDPYQEN